MRHSTARDDPKRGKEALWALAATLGARRVPALSAGEHALLAGTRPASRAEAASVRRAVGEGADPLGERLLALRSPSERRALGQTFTPQPLVDAMLGWATPYPIERVVDPGVGSGRFLVAAGRVFPRARLLGSDVDPMATLTARAHLSCAGLARRARIVVGDFRALHLPSIAGRTLFAGNPPYVRHHGISKRWKAWLARSAERLGVRASRLAGLHVHFLVAIAGAARAGDAGVIVTAAEWLDTGYGALPRRLFLDVLGGRRLDVIDARSHPFQGVDATAVVTCFEVGSRPTTVAVRRVPSLERLGALEGGATVPRDRLEGAGRWSQIGRRGRARRPGWVELGELCAVHRGQVTGMNRVWVVEPNATSLPAELLVPAITRARELFGAGVALESTASLRRVVELPDDLDTLAPAARRAVARFLDAARRAGAHRAYVARHRRAWWVVRLRPPAPILATYMARRPPAFVRNLAGARHLNIAHGLYPREPLTDARLDQLATALRRVVEVADGRTYAGGLVKFEPRELERVLVPWP